MRFSLAYLLPVMASLALTSCGSSDDRQGVGGVTASEAKALNEAAAMLDERADNAAIALEVEPLSRPAHQ